MKLDEALPILKSACNIPIRELFKNHPEDLRTNKGNVGQLLLKYIGLSLDSNLCDFEDGELKTNKTHANGEPAETMFITQISAIIDELVSCPPKKFEESNLYIKIRNLVFLPVVKDSKDVGDWYFLNAYHVQAPIGSDLFKRLEADYYSICSQLRRHIETSPMVLCSAVKIKREWIRWIFCALAVLYNLVLTVHLGDKTDWTTINFSTATFI